MSSSKRLVFAVFASLSAAVGCGAADASSDEELGSTAPGPPPVSWEEFKQNAHKEPWRDGVYVVDRDIPLANEEELYAYYLSWFDERSALTVDRVFDTDNTYPVSMRFGLSYCISDEFGDSFEDVEVAMASAAASWADWIGVGFSYASGYAGSCDEDNANVFFDVRPVADDGYIASSFFPDDARAARSVRLRPMALTTSSGGRDLDGILRHELGHTLGFIHEHVWLNGSCTDEAVDGARAVTEYDVNSVMHYPQCRPSQDGGYRQTDDDYRGSVELYGLSALLITSSNATIQLL